MAEFRYRAFISYSWADRDWGDWLHRALETYHPPKGVADGRPLRPIFKDREEEAAGASIGAAIEAAMAASEYLIVLCSPRSAQSKWVNREVAWFKTHRDPSKILALIVDGEPMASSLPGREAEECFPQSLLYAVGPDLQPAERLADAPLAADARKTGDGRHGAKLKLAAALLGVGYDVLARRDERRRTIRRRLVTSAAFGLALLLGGLSVFAFNQRDAALVAKNDAVKARDDAEGLIELILTDLKTDLEGFGTLKSVTQIGNRAIGYYEGQDVKALSPDQLGRRARVLLMLGEADNKRGDLKAALARYETAAMTTGEQLARDPENPQRLFDHAQSVFWVGYIAWQRGDRDKAKRQFTDYHDYAQCLVAKDPANEDWQAELEYAYSNLGTLAMDAGEAAEAEAWFRKALEISLAKLAKAPDDIERVLSAGQAYAWLADALHRQVKLDEARDTRGLEMGLYQQQTSEAATGAKIMRPKTVAEYALAQIEIAQGDLSSAAQRSSRASALADAALKIDPSRTDLLLSSAIAHGVFGEASLHLGDFTEAIAALEQSQKNSKLLNSIGPTAEWSGYPSTLPELMMARAEIGVRNHPRAKKRLNQLISSQLARDRSATDPISLRVLVLALATRARLENNHQDWKRIVDLVGDATARQSPETLAVLAEALEHLGDVAKARQVSSNLYAKGYRHPDFVAATGGASPDLHRENGNP